MTLSLDETMMRRALELARQGQGRVEPNPMVGAVLCQGDKIVGEGWHQAFGGPHAEIHALKQAGEQAKDATLYVTLEPCCHHGKTPPCTDAVIQSGIRKLVVAGTDPFPAVAGKGIDALRQAGVEVIVGVCQKETEDLNAPYRKLVQQGLPYVIAKWAMTLDGKIATETGDSKWISGEQSRQVVHELRGRVDAIVVGIGTALADDPLLTARPSGPRVAARIVLDSQLRMPIQSQLVRTARSTKVVVVHASHDQERVQRLEAQGCECLLISTTSRSEMIRGLLVELGRRRMTNILVEGGARVLGSFLDSQSIDEIWTFIAPRWIGSAYAPGPVAGQGVHLLAQAGELVNMTISQSGVDVFVRGQCRYPK